MGMMDKQNVIMDKILELMSSKGALSESKLRKFLDQFIIIDRKTFKEHIVGPGNYDNLDPRALCKFYIDAYCGISTELIKDTNSGYYKDAPGLIDIACELLVYELNKKQREDKEEDASEDTPTKEPVPTTPIPNDGTIAPTVWPSITEYPSLMQSSHCDGCPVNPKNKRDEGVTVGDTPCTFCPYNPLTPKCK